MGKSVYSLVLTDGVVDEIDKLAYGMGISRSALIDRILAERTGFTTSEMRISNILSEINKILDEAGNGFIVKADNQSMLIRSSLKYKYNPTIRYGVQVIRADDYTEVELKVSFRTQSAELKKKMEDFLRLWAVLENKYIAKRFPYGIQYVIEDGKFTRKLVLPGQYRDKTNEDIGRAIGEYIRMFDDVLKCYFSYGDDMEAAAHMAERYREHLREGIIFI